MFYINCAIDLDEKVQSAQLLKMMDRLKDKVSHLLQAAQAHQKLDIP